MEAVEVGGSGEDSDCATLSAASVAIVCGSMPNAASCSGDSR